MSSRCRAATLAFQATAGALTLTDADGNAEADIELSPMPSTTSSRASGPVTFVVNGEPGAATTYLRLGVLGPWYLPMDSESIVPSQAVELVPNPQTWLDFTDLVFVDPAGTCFSRLAGPDERLRDRYLSIDGDVEALSEFIRRWLTENGRIGSAQVLRRRELRRFSRAARRGDAADRARRGARRNGPAVPSA